MHNYVDATDEAARRSEPEATDWRLLPHGDELAEFLHVYIPRVKAHTIYCDPHCYVVRLEHEYSMPYGCADCNLIQQFVDNLSSNVWIGVCESPKGHLRDGPLGADGWWGSVRVGVGVGVSVSVSLGAALGAALLARCRALWCALGALSVLSVLSGALGHYPGALGALRRSGDGSGALGRYRTLSDALRHSGPVRGSEGDQRGIRGSRAEQSAGDQSMVKGIRGEQRGGKQHPHHTHPNRTGVRPPTPRPTPKAKGQKAPQTFPAKTHPPASVVVHFFGLLVGLCYVGGWVLSMFWIAVWVMAGCVFWVLVCSVL